MIEAGGDGTLRYLPDSEFTFDPNSSADFHYGRQAAHHILYTLANSSAMIGAMPGSTLTGIPIDQTLRIVLTLIGAAGTVWFGYVVFRSIRPSKRKMEAIARRRARREAKATS